MAIGHNLPPAILGLHELAYEHAETTIHRLVDEMHGLKHNCDRISNLSNRLSHCKASGKADFSNDPEMCQLIDHVHTLDSSVFGHGDRYVWNSATEIDVGLQALDGLIKAKFSDVNEKMMLVNKEYDSRGLTTEAMQKILEMAIRHLESLVSKQRQH